MLDTRFLRGSDGTGNAVAARVNTIRIVGASVLKVDAVTKWPAGAFIATVGTLNSNGYLDPSLAPITEFRGHLSGADIIIDSYEPGYSDVGNAVNQYVILKQTTGWSNLVQDAMAENQTEIIQRSDDFAADYIKSGGVWSLVSGLNGGMTAVTAYQAGYRATLAAVASRAFTASKDTYVDLLRGGTIYAPTYTLVYTEVANNATSPVLAANSIRLAVVITSGSAITSIISTGMDALGNRIGPKAPVDGSVASQLWWEEVARVKLTASGNLLEVRNLPNKKYFRVIATPRQLGSIDCWLYFNGDFGANYAYSGMYANTAGANANQTGIAVNPSGSASDKLIEFDVMNINGYLKLASGQSSEIGAGGANVLPYTASYAGKWIGTALINQITIKNLGGGQFFTDSEIIVLAHD
jgi:hypothetical protein